MNQEKPSFKAGSFILLLVATCFIPLIGIIVGAINIKSPNRKGQSGALMGLGIIMFLWTFIGGLGEISPGGAGPQDGGTNSESGGGLTAADVALAGGPIVTCKDCGGNGVCPICGGTGIFEQYGNYFCSACGGNGVCNRCEGEKRYRKSVEIIYHGYKKGLCSECRAMGKCHFCAGDGDAFGGRCSFCNSTGQCYYCKGQKFRYDCMDWGVKAQE